MRSTDVGRSSRTPYKHFLLDSQLGKVVGIGRTRVTDSFADFSNFPFLCIDLCAGDGVVVEGEHTSSPYLLSKHCWHAEKPTSSSLIPFETQLVLIEKNERTAERLRDSMESYSQKPKAQYGFQGATRARTPGSSRARLSLVV
jgi:hypothetical protein